MQYIFNIYQDCDFMFQLIISSDNFRFENNNKRPTPPPTAAAPLVTTVKYPTNPFLPITPSSSQQSPLNCNSYPKHPMCGEVGIIETTTFQTLGKLFYIM